MTKRVTKFVEGWIQENVHAKGCPLEGDYSEAAMHAYHCVIAAESAGIPCKEINDEYDLLGRMSEAIASANDEEVALSGKKRTDQTPIREADARLRPSLRGIYRDGASKLSVAIGARILVTSTSPMPTTIIKAASKKTFQV